MFRCILGILLLVALMPPASCQQPGGDLEQARARWEHMSPAEKARIAQHFREFRELPDAERERMRSHLARIAEARREIEEHIPDELRAKLELLGPTERQQVLREYVESAMGERAERLREKMSRDWLQKLDGATPAEREALLKGKRDELRDRAPRAIEWLSRQLGLPPEEVARLKALPPEEMRAALADLGRREMERRGPPPGVDPQEFGDWKQLPPPEFMERMHCHGQRGFRGDGERGGPPPDGLRPPPPDGRMPPPEGHGRPPEGRGRGGDPLGGPGPEGRHDGERGGRPPQGGPPGGPPPDGPRGPRRESRLTPEGQDGVFKALRPDREWIIELAQETREARREEIDRRIHARVVERLRGESSVTTEELRRLNELSGREFFEALREIVGDPPRGFGDHRRRDRRE